MGVYAIYFYCLEVVNQNVASLFYPDSYTVC